MECREVTALLPAYVDLELTAREAAAVEAHLSGCPGCDAACELQRAMQRAVREQATYFAVPEALTARLPASPTTPPARTQNAARIWSGALAAGVALAVGAGYFLQQRAGEEAVSDEIVSAHVRSLMADHLTDVASSDQHTVKPWFNGRLDFSPDVRDLTTQGFPLLGGRLDYLAGRPVAALVYRHRKHLVNLFVAPAGEPAHGDAAPRESTLHGYHILRWVHDGMAFDLVSDVSNADLEHFRTILLQIEEN